MENGKKEERKEEIIVFTEGDANLASTWSNVPYFLTKTLENKNYNVRRVNIAVNKIIPGMIAKIIKIFLKKTTYSANRTKWYTTMAEIKMKKAVKKYKNAQYFITTNFSYSPYKYTNKPILLFCDWTYEYYIRYFQNRLPDSFENKEIKRQNRQIENSDYIITLFPQVCEYMKKHYNNPNIYYLGNVVNTIDTVNENIIEQKEQSNKILFIGNKKYLKAAKMLIEAFSMLKHTDLELHIIGLTKEELQVENKNVFLYGYLNKSNPKEKAMYCKLVTEAKVCINTNEKWAGFSSIIECMYYFTPVITTPYIEFVETFGKKIKFGYYCEKNNPDIIKNKIEKISNMGEQEYREMCIEAHENVKSFSWDSYVDKMIEILNKKDQ